MEAPDGQVLHHSGTRHRSVVVASGTGCRPLHQIKLAKDTTGPFTLSPAGVIPIPLNTVMLIPDWWPSIPVSDTMRLFTHNFLQCHVKGCTSNNFPLSLSETEIAQREAEFSSDFMKAYMCKLDYVALLATINEVGSIVWDAFDCGPSDAPSLFSLN